VLVHGRSSLPIKATQRTCEIAELFSSSGELK